MTVRLVDTIVATLLIMAVGLSAPLAQQQKAGESLSPVNPTSMSQTTYEPYELVDVTDVYYTIYFLNELPGTVVARGPSEFHIVTVLQNVETKVVERPVGRDLGMIYMLGSVGVVLFLGAALVNVNKRHWKPAVILFGIAFGIGALTLRTYWYEYSTVRFFIDNADNRPIQVSVFGISMDVPSKTCIFKEVRVPFSRAPIAIPVQAFGSARTFAAEPGHYYLWNVGKRNAYKVGEAAYRKR